MWSTKFDPMKPHPPVTSVFFTVRDLRFRHQGTKALRTASGYQQFRTRGKASQA
jgi:hypothetical protein